MKCYADSEHFVQEQTLALVHNLVDGYVDSANYVIGEDGMVIDAIARQLNNASAPGVCIQVSILLKTKIRSSPACSRKEKSILQVLFNLFTYIF